MDLASRIDGATGGLRADLERLARIPPIVLPREPAAGSSPTARADLPVQADLPAGADAAFRATPAWGAV
ncbi:hypothetical protein [Streptomyces sp. NPDC020965]|uniref:hypothetical protein n=1 Tax=Streptomyces sp. NPDC020965 TaxID=3365105 RepID=UPI0037ADD7CA